MNSRKAINFANGLAAIVAMPLLLISSAVTIAAEEQAVDHSQMDHDMAGHSTERDEMGRRLHGMKHTVTPEIVEELRTKVVGWEDVTDAEVQLSMQMMGANYQWYISDDDVSGDTGVLIIFHGVSDRGDKFLK